MIYNKEFYIKQTIKYALLLDDMALKSSTDQDRFLLGRAAKLLRELGNEMRNADDGEATGSETQQAQV